MDATFKSKEKEFIEILKSYAQFISIQVHKYNLLRYGLDPEDIMQDVKIKLWKLVDSQKTIISQAAYIKKIVNSAVIDQLRKQRRDEGLLRHEKQKHISEIDLAYRKEATRSKPFEEILGKAVEQLIDTRRQVVKLYLLDLSILEISHYLNWSQDKIRNLLYRGLTDLRESLNSTDINNENR